WIDEVRDGDGVSILQDSSIYSYLFFKNQIVKISAGNPVLMNYEELKEGVYVWRKTIIDRDISLINMDDPKNLNACEYYRFIKRLVGLGPDSDEYSLSDVADKFSEGQKLYSFISA